MCEPKTILPGYTVEKKLSSGGHGTCYQVRHNGICCVLKDYKTDDERESLHEARVYEVLHGSGKGNEYFFKGEHLEFNGKHYLLSQTHEGETVAELLSREPNMSLIEKVDILLRACRAVSKIHKTGYIHLDIKPSNLYVSASKTLVTPIDMGSAIQKRENSKSAPSFTDIMETIGYMSTNAYASLRVREFNFQREQCRELFYKEENGIVSYPYVPDNMVNYLCVLENRIGVKDDIYSLLCCAFFVLTNGRNYNSPAGIPQYKNADEIKNALYENNIPDYLTGRLTGLFMLLYAPSEHVDKEIKYDSVEELIKELNVIKEIEQNQGFHPEVLLRNAQKYEQHFADVEIDPELLTDIEMKDKQ